MRLFVGLPVPDHVRTLVTAASAPAREYYRELSWSRPEGWHVTLAFLGQVDEERLGEVSDTLAGRRRRGPIQLDLGSVGQFGRRVLVVHLHDRPEGEVAALGTELQESLAAAGLPVDDKPVRPHLTLARATRRGGRVSDAAVDAVAPVEAAWEAEAFDLYVSQLGGRGPARYESLGSWTLSG